jgi:hypothetical protein
VRDFKKLHVWHKAHPLALNIDRLTTQITARQYAPLKNQRGQMMALAAAGLGLPAAGW